MALIRWIWSDPRQHVGGEEYGMADKAFVALPAFVDATECTKKAPFSCFGREHRCRLAIRVWSSRRSDRRPQIDPISPPRRRESGCRAPPRGYQWKHDRVRLRRRQRTYRPPVLRSTVDPSRRATAEAGTLMCRGHEARLARKIAGQRVRQNRRLNGIGELFEATAQAITHRNGRRSANPKWFSVFICTSTEDP